MGPTRGKQVVLTAPLTESIDHAGFFIQMSLASIPGWMEWVIDKKYPMWRDVPRHEDGSAGTAPAGLRVVEDVVELVASSAGTFGVAGEAHEEGSCPITGAGRSAVSVT